MSVLPRPVRALYYWINEQGRVGKFIVNAGSYAYMGTVRLLGLKPWQDLSALTIVSHKYKFIYIGIPKIATRSFQDIFINDRQRARNFDIEWSEKPFAFRNYIQKHPDYFVFGFVRNPYSRVVSCYSSKIEGCEPGKQARIMSFYKNLSPRMSFRDFVSWLNTSEGRDEIADRHWISQYLYFEDERGHDIANFIGYYEQLDEDWAKICHQLDLGLIPLRQKGWVTKDKFKRSYKDYLDSESIDLIVRRYATDLKKFGYTGKNESSKQEQ